MLVPILVVMSIALVVAWVITEIKLGTRSVRILLGSSVIASASLLVWELKDLEYRLLSLWVSMAFEEVSAQVAVGNDTAVQQAITRYLEKTRHDPSNKAAAGLIHELNPAKFSGSRR
jgi:hypothetical protein